MNNAQLFGLSLRAHPGLQLCWIYPALGVLSGLLGSTDNHHWERALMASGALAVLVWPVVLWTAWTGRNQYKDKLRATQSAKGVSDA